MNSNDQVQVRIGERLLLFQRKSLLKLQAIWRGQLVRRRLAVVRQEYIDIAYEIEESSAQAYPWISPVQDFPKAANIRLDSRDSASTPQSEPGADDPVRTARSEDENIVTCIVKSDFDSNGNDDKNIDCVKNSDSCQNRDLGSATNPVRTHKHVTMSPNDSSSPSEPASRSESRIGSSSRSNSVIRSDSDARPESRVGFVNITNGFSDSPSDSCRRDRAVHSSLRDSVDTRGDTTSIWDTTELSPQHNSKGLAGLTAPELEHERNQAMLELYWVQQAIDSRKQYLQFRDQLTQGVA